MTANTKQLEQKFNDSLPKTTQTQKLDARKRTKFNKASFVKSAEALRKVVKENDDRELTKS